MSIEKLEDIFPTDPAMMLSYINMLLRDEYPAGLDALCEDRGVDRDAIIEKMGQAGFEYSAEANKFW